MVIAFFFIKLQTGNIPDVSQHKQIVVHSFNEKKQTTYSCNTMNEFQKHAE